MKTLTKKNPITGVTAMLVCLLASASAQAAINACKDNTTGALRVAPTCNANETQLTWDNAGPRGPAGLQGPPGARGATGNPALPGATLNSLAADVQANLSEGPASTGTCSNNPWLANPTPCPPVQSQCPSGLPIKTNLTCAVLPSADAETIKAIALQIFSYDFLSDQMAKASIDKTSGIVSCSTDAVFAGGFSPWCFYKLGGGQFGAYFGWMGHDGYHIQTSSGTNTVVTAQELQDPNNWQCFPITIQAKAQCVTIPQNVKSILQHFGIAK